MKPFYQIYSPSDDNFENLGGSNELSLEEGYTQKFVEQIYKTALQNPLVLVRQELKSTQKDYHLYAPSLALTLDRMRFTKVINNPNMCESIVKRKVLYVGKINVTDPAKNKPLIKRPIKVTVTDLDIDFGKDKNGLPCPRLRKKCNEGKCSEFEKEGLLRNKCVIRGKPVPLKLGSTNEEGLFDISLIVEHNVYDTQKFFLKEIQFKADGFAPKSRVVAFLPWEYGFLTYQDFTGEYTHWQEDLSTPILGSRLADELEQDIFQVMTKSLSRPPSIRLNEYQSILVEPSYEIQPSLDITTIRNSLFLLRPNITRYDSQGQSIRTAPLVMPRGYWLLRILFVKGPYETTEDGLSKMVSPWNQWNVTEEGKDPFTKKETSGLFNVISHFYNELSRQMDMLDSQEISIKENLSDFHNHLVNQFLSQSHQTCLDTGTNAEGFFDQYSCDSTVAPNL